MGYAYVVVGGTIVLATVWGKNERANLNAKDKKAISQVLAEAEKIIKSQRKGGK